VPVLRGHATEGASPRSCNWIRDLTSVSGVCCNERLVRTTGVIALLIGSGTRTSTRAGTRIVVAPGSADLLLSWRVAVQALVRGSGKEERIGRDGHVHELDIPEGRVRLTNDDGLTQTRNCSDCSYSASWPRDSEHSVSPAPPLVASAAIAAAGAIPLVFHKTPLREDSLFQRWKHLMCPCIHETDGNHECRTSRAPA